MDINLSGSINLDENENNLSSLSAVSMTSRSAPNSPNKSRTQLQRTNPLDNSSIEWEVFKELKRKNQNDSKKQPSKDEGTEQNGLKKTNSNTNTNESPISLRAVPEGTDNGKNHGTDYFTGTSPAVNSDGNGTALPPPLQVSFIRDLYSCNEYFLFLNS